MYKYFLCCFTAVSLLLSVGCNDSDLIVSEIQDTNSEIQLKNSDESGGYVYLCGAVNNPGVYEIHGDTRLFEIVDLAGGLDEEADIDSVNLAGSLHDGDSVRIPFYGENIIQDGLININTADIAELTTIPGIGENRAKAIIEYREQNGPFKSTEELMQISGIKEAMFQRIKAYVCVE